VCCDLIFLRAQKVGVTLTRCESVGYLAKRLRNGLLVREQRLLLARRVDIHLINVAAGIDERLQQERSGWAVRARHTSSPACIRHVTYSE